MQLQLSWFFKRCKYQITTFLRKIWGSKTFLFFDDERNEWHIQLRKDLKYDGTGIDLVTRYPEATNPINAGILDCTGKVKATWINFYKKFQFISRKKATRGRKFVIYYRKYAKLAKPRKFKSVTKIFTSQIPAAKNMKIRGLGTIEGLISRQKKINFLKYSAI